jgi:hypothetical protein
MKQSSTPAIGQVAGVGLPTDDQRMNCPWNKNTPQKPGQRSSSISEGYRQSREKQRNCSISATCASVRSSTQSGINSKEYFLHIYAASAIESGRA